MSTKRRIRTLADAVQTFLAGYRPTTATTYGDDLKPMVAWLGANRPLQVVENGERYDYFEPADLTEYVNLGLIRREPPLSPATIEKRKKTMRTFWNWAKRNGYVEQSPFVVPSKKLDVAVDADKIMPDHLLRQLLAYAMWEPRRYALVLFLAQTGCRRSGAAGLTIDRLDLAGQRATVIEKPDKVYTVYFDEVCAAALRDWLSRRGNMGGYIFSKDGREITASALAQYFRRTCINAGIGSWGPHTLRHRRGDQLQRGRVDPKTAAKVMGHRNYTTTLDYYYHEDQTYIEEKARQTIQVDDPKQKLRKFGG